jgi:uncharacterized protein YndB with AHSA1/START domain
MSDQALKAATESIVVDEIFPHAPETIWRLLASADLMERWLMKPTGYEPIVGNRFTFSTTPAGAWDGTIRCEVLEVVPNERLVFAWKGGHADNVGYGSPLDTVVTFTLTRASAGTRVRLVHSGFRLPRNETAYTNMSKGWTKVFGSLSTLAATRH